MNSKSFNILLIIAVLAATLVATWLMDGHRGNISTASHSAVAAQTDEITAEIAPSVTLTALDGAKIPLHDYKGKIILLNFWATWCAPCIAEWPQFIKLAQMMPDDLVILAVSIDDDKGKIAPFLKRYAANYRKVPNIKLLHDADKSVSQDLFQTVRVPETVIITPTMKMTRKVAGLDLKWDSDDTKNYLRSLQKN